MAKNFFFVLLLFVVAFAAFKIGDKHGFKAGYEYGYTFDCQEDLRALKRIVDGLNHSVTLTKEEVARVKNDNARLRKDSLEKIVTPRMRDSIHQLKLKAGYPDLTNLQPQND